MWKLSYPPENGVSLGSLNWLFLKQKQAYKNSFGSQMCKQTSIKLSARDLIVCQKGSYGEGKRGEHGS